ncbi:Ig domain-containing protein [Streptomyces sp. NBC_01387]|uniref:Ig domain-containing protein n=1 Tax=Streptomyces sp. NBC_01387 TaxID=2903849 RepID=UPI00324ACF84
MNLKRMNPRRKLTARLTATIAVTGMLTAGPVAIGAESASAATGSNHSGDVLVNAGYLRVGMDDTGAVTSLVDSRNGRNYLVAGHGTAPLVSLVIGGKQVKPTSLKRAGDKLVFRNSAAGTEIDVAVLDRTTYTTLTVTKVKAPHGADVQTLLWGPLATTLTDTLGESAGVAGNSGFTAGMKVLNDRTEGGWPREDTGMGWESEVSNNPSDLQVAPLEQWSTGGHTSWGNLLRAFTFDYTKQRLRMNDSGYRIPVGPLPSGGGIVGSEVALYGTTPDLAPTVLSAIAKGQNLPYPTIDGQWQKTAQATSKSILVLSDLNTGNVDAADKFAKAAGIDTVYSLPGADGPWQSAGHYQFNSSFGSNDAAATGLVKTSSSNGVAVGAHTLSNFIDTNDSYVSPTASPDLALGQSTTLTRPLAAGDTSLSLASCAPLAAGLQGSRLLIGKEFLTYTGSSTVDGECQVTGLARGQWSSAAASHAAGDTVARVQMNGYGGAYGNLNIINSVATRFADIWNTTGITATSFDGLESASDAGWGQYGMARMVNGAYAQLKAKDGFISETSRMGSNIWDGLSRASWGEVGSTSMSQVLINNAYYQANYLPGMLGWIALPGNTGLPNVEDTLARGAGLNAGAGFETSVSSLTGGGQNTSALLDSVKQWETARNLGAFTDGQRAQFRDQSTHWHLSVITPGSSWSLQQRDASGKDIGAPRTVTVPKPGFRDTGLPGMTAGKLYEARPAANVPSIIRYRVTAGALPAGLRLNADTGGITGIPATGATSTFTLTGTGAPGTPDARQTFTIHKGNPKPTTGTLSLTSAFDNVGITSQTDVTPGNFDGAGNSFSAEQLAAADVIPGSTVTVKGTAFAWPKAAAGTPDNVVGSSAVIQGSGRGGSTLAFLGSEAGDVTDHVTVAYTDGTTSTASVGFPNWADSSPTEFGSTLAVSTQGRNTPGGYANTSGAYRVFRNEIPLDSGKTIATVELPASPKIHVFALTVA